MSDHKSNSGDLPLLVIAKVQRDASLTKQVMNSSGIHSVSIDPSDCSNIDLQKYGAVLVAAEVLSQNFLSTISAKIRNQPPWSEITVILVTNEGDLDRAANQKLEMLSTQFRSITILEKPIRVATLVTVARSALQTRKKQFELKVVLDQLDISKRAAEDASEAKSTFLANMSHEIRTPLAAVIGFSDMLKNVEITSAEREEAANIISRNAKQLSGLINDILDISKIEAGKLIVERVAVSLPSFIAELTSLLRPLVQIKELEFISIKPEALPALVSLDPNRFRQILINLISNAVKFTQHGSILVEFQIEERSTSQADLIATVTDMGIGIEASQAERLFNPFTQADPSMTRKYGGTGLGLSLSRQLAHAMGGVLILESSVIGVGSKFRCSVPVELVHSQVMPEAGLMKGIKSLESLHILLAEDSPDNQLLMKRYLTNSGAQVTVVDNGQSALDAVTRNDYDIVLMDIQMPILDGLSATRKLRDSGFKKPILALTAHAMAEEKVKSIAAGCNDHLSKPITKSDLVDAVYRFATAKS